MANPLSTKGRTADSVLPSVRIFVAIVFILIKSLHVAEARGGEARFKYVLVWTNKNTYPVIDWIYGHNKLIEYNCPVSDCYITSRRDFFGGDVTKFDAVIFNGRDLKNAILSELPRKRSPRQKYIFLNDECSENQPICSSIFDGFFNWTATYKLHSDIVTGYLEIINAAGEVVGPRTDMRWTYNMSDLNDTLLSTLKRKTKAAAWFVSHCKTRSRRENYARSLQKALTTHNLTLDIFGNCGKLKCPVNDKITCFNMLRDNYYFYLSFENSFGPDYITEKALTALTSDTVPILYGAADYSRFLPYGSYINARMYEPAGLAYFMVEMIRNPDEYRKFFSWRNVYRYQAPNHLCRICAALNNRTKFEAHSVYRDFRGWWHPNHQKRCKDTTWYCNHPN